MREAEADLARNGSRLLLRYSGTEPKARLLLEGPEDAPLREWNKKIAGAIKAQLGR